MKIERRQLVIILVLAVMLGCFIFLQYLPMSKAIAEAKQQQKQALVESEKAKTSGEMLPDMNQKLAELKLKVGDFNAKVPLSRDYGSFFQNVSELMGRYDLHNQVVKPGDEVPFEEVNGIEINIECEGSLDDVFNFLKDFEASQRVFNISKFHIDNSKYDGNVKLVIEGSIFYRK